MTDNRQNRIQSFAFVISAFSALCFAVYFAPKFITLNSSSAAGTIHLNNKINPNIAGVESLVRLPDIGLSRAEAIIEYRNNFITNHNGRNAFETFDDLQNIKGIGPKTTENLKELLEFK